MKYCSRKNCLLVMRPLRCTSVVPLVLTIWRGLSAAQVDPTVHQPLVGRYEVISLRWTPANEGKIKSPVERFELSAEPDRDARAQNGPFRVHTLTKDHQYRAWGIGGPFPMGTACESA